MDAVHTVTCAFISKPNREYGVKNKISWLLFMAHGVHPQFFSWHLINLYFLRYLIFMAAHSNGQANICCSCGFYLSFFLLFFLAYSQPSQIGCLPYFHTWCGLSANLACMFEMYCKGLAEIEDAKITQKCHLRIPPHNFVGLCLGNWGMYQQSEKAC